MPTAKPTKTATKRVRSTKPKPKLTSPSQEQIAERAYFIHLEDRRRDELANWLRAERELTAA